MRLKLGLALVVVVGCAVSVASYGSAQTRDSFGVFTLPRGSTWDSLYLVFQQHPIDDGEAAETFSDFVVHRLATHWGTLPALSRLVARDTAFHAFVLKHIDATTEERELRRIEVLARTRCPPRLGSLCGAIRRAAREAAAQAAQPNLGLKLPGRQAALARDQLGPYVVMNRASAARAPARSLNPSR